MPRAGDAEISRIWGLVEWFPRFVFCRLDSAVPVAGVLRKGHANTTSEAQFPGSHWNTRASARLRPIPRACLWISKPPELRILDVAAESPRFIPTGTENVTWAWDRAEAPSHTIWVSTAALVFSLLDTGRASQACVWAPGSEESYARLKALLSPSWNS